MSVKSDMKLVIGVVGAGAMGAGIAQVAAQAGHEVLLFDAKAEMAEKGRNGILKALDRLVEKGRLADDTRQAIAGRLKPAADLAEFSRCGLVVEAIVEDLSVKKAVFGALEAIVTPEAILASNTSSISITAIAAGMKHPERIAGMHFFNPAPLMALVEIIAGLASASAVLETLESLALAWGKVPVRAKSTPGFIVNRVARPFYAEGLRLLEEGVADAATLDALMREAGGFRMGPFELMDLIGHDVNFAVTCSVFAAYFNDPRFRPSLTQQELVAAGWLGRKSGRGFYDYATGVSAPTATILGSAPHPSLIIVEGELGAAEPLIARAIAAGLTVERTAGEGLIRLPGARLALTDGRTATARAAAGEGTDLVLFDLALDYRQAGSIAVAGADQAPEGALMATAGFFQALGVKVSAIADSPGLVVMRTLAMLANEAAETVLQGVASARDIDLAMRNGVNYPRGPLEWAEAVGRNHILAVLCALQEGTGDDRYRASALLRRHVASGKPLSPVPA